MKYNSIINIYFSRMCLDIRWQRQEAIEAYRASGIIVLLKTPTKYKNTKIKSKNT